MGANGIQDRTRCGIEWPLPPHSLDLPDGVLASFAEFGRLCSGLIAIPDWLRPAPIITIGPERGTGHPDHRFVGNVVTQIVEGDERSLDVDLLYASLPTEHIRAAPQQDRA